MPRQTTKAKGKEIAPETIEQRLKILMVEDLSTDAELIKYELRKNSIQFECQVVENAYEYQKALAEFLPELILSDYNLPSFNGMEALELRKELAPDIPFILVTGTNNEEIAVECMKAGADDYILKDNLTRIGQAIKAALQKKIIIKANKEAFEQLSILSRAVEQNPALIIITDKEGSIEYVNPKFTETTGYTKEEVIGKNSRILKSGNHQAEFYANLWTTVLAGKEWSAELLNKKKNGDLYWESASISPMVNEKGEITHFVAIKEDITEKRRMLDDLIIAKEKAEAGDRLKSAFINNISHEIRTPLSGIVGFSEMLLSHDITIENRTVFIDIIKKSSVRLMNTISNYMDISLLVSGNMEVHNNTFFINKVLDDLRDEFNDSCIEKHININIEKPLMSDIQIFTDHDLLHKVFYHLLDNAVKFTHQGGITFGYRKTPGNIEFFVTDTGIGIEKGKTKLIFDYFMQGDVSQTRAYEGSGLGLSIARELIKVMGGKIYLSSVENQGTTVCFSLSDKLIMLAPEALDTNIKQTGWKSNPVILVAEDDDFNYKYLEIILKRCDYEVLRAVNGVEAIDICKSNQDVDLVLMDMKMPQLGGLEATRQIRTFLPFLPIIALTAYVSQSDENEAFAAGCNEFMSKPVNKPKLLALIQKIVGR